MKKINFLILGMLFIWGACRKDTIDRVVTVDNPTPVEYVKTTIVGIVSYYNTPIENATVTIGDKTTKTDALGTFRIKDVKVNSHATYVKVEHPDFTFSSRTINVSAGTMNKVNIYMIPKYFSGVFDGESGGKVNSAYGSVTFEKNGVMKSDSSVYNGLVSVKFDGLDPSNYLFEKFVPGRLVGINKNGLLKGMVTFGIVDLEIRNQSNEKLQIKTGTEALIKMKIPDDLISKAPYSVSMWYFNEINGLWIEEGEATLVNGFYEGKVKHFSAWSFGYEYETVELKVNLVDSNGNPVTGVKVTAQLEDDFIATTYVDNLAQTCIIVPKDKPFKLSVYPEINGCLGPILAQEVGPYSQNDMITLTVNLTQPEVYTINGRLLDCNGNPLTSGYIYTSVNSAIWDTIYANEVIFSDLDGNFSYTINACLPLTNLSIQGYDFENLQVSNSISVPIIGSVGNAGDIIVCGNLLEFISFSNGIDINFTGVSPQIIAQDSVSGGSIDLITLSTNSQNSALNITIKLQNINGIGSYRPSYFLVGGTYAGQNIQQSCYDIDCNDLTFQITEFNGIGGLIAGTYYGSVFNNQTNMQTSVYGTFKGILTQ
jgi:hypothetical protein